jgi:hypothetical protein
VFTPASFYGGNCLNKLRLQPKSFPKKKKRGKYELVSTRQTPNSLHHHGGFPKRLPHLYSTAEPLTSHLIHSSCRPGLPGPSLANAGPPRPKKSSAQQPTDLNSTVAQLPDDVQYNPATCRLAFRASTRAATCVLRASALSAGQRCLVIRMTRRRVGQPGAVERRFVKLLG